MFHDTGAVLEFASRIFCVKLAFGFQISSKKKFPSPKATPTSGLWVSTEGPKFGAQMGPILGPLR